MQVVKRCAYRLLLICLLPCAVVTAIASCFWEGTADAVYTARRDVKSEVGAFKKIWREIA